jgi:preprotein translocase subunit SecG
MENVILVIHLLIALSIIGLVLLQRSEGGGLGIGGGGGGVGGIASPKATANMLTRTTGILAACFFSTSLILGVLAGGHSRPTSILDSVENPVPALEEGMEKVSDEVEAKPEAAKPKLDDAPAVPVSE